MSLIGIDLGTTFCAIATLDDRGPAGDAAQPRWRNADAVGGVPRAGRRRRSSARRRSTWRSNSRTASPCSSSGAWGIRTSAAPSPAANFRPETLSAIILRKLVQDAELHVGPMTQGVITVPAYFDDTRRKATKDAGRIAGLDVLDILDEPTAAALAYSFQQAAALVRRLTAGAAARPDRRPSSSTISAAAPST